MKNTIKITTFLSLMLMLTPSAHAAPSLTEVMLNNYVRDEATHQLDLMLPRGKFNIQVNVTVNQTKVKEENEIQPVKMPMGSSYISGNELKASGALDTSAEHLLSYIKKIELTLSVVPSVSPEVREVLRTSLMSALGMDVNRGDLITMTELPESFSSVWLAPTPIPVATPIATPVPTATPAAIEEPFYKKPVAIMGGSIGFLFLIGIFVIFAAFRQMGTLLSQEARNLSVTLKDAIETGAGGGMGMNSPTLAASGASGAGKKHDPFDTSTTTFWEKVDIDTIAAFCFDCLGHSKYSGVPEVLINNLLDPSKVDEFEKKFPIQNLDLTPNEKNQFKASEVTQIFQMYMSEYRRAIRSPMARQVLAIDVEQLHELSKTLGQSEVTLLINSLTPMKRASFLKTLSTSAKLELAEAAKQTHTGEEHKSLEAAVANKIGQIVIHDQKKNDFSLNYLTSIILKAESYAEDESIYEHVKTSGQGDYKGVLNALDLFENTDWDEMNLQDLAIAFSGYSSKYKEELFGKFTGKKLEWFKNFVTKFEAKAPDFNSETVVSIQDTIKERIQKIADAREVSATESIPEKDAA